MGHQHKPEYQPGEIVIFTPSNEAIAWAKGRRRVLRVLGDYIQLECGNIKLLATVAELKTVSLQTRDYEEICKRYGVRSLCDLANELERRGFPRPETFQAGQVWYNTGGTRVEVVRFRNGLAAEYYSKEGRLWQKKTIKNAPGAFAVYLPTVHEIKTWEISRT